MAEARALRDCLSSAIQAGFNRLIVEGDNKIVIQALEWNIHMPWQIHNIIKDIRTWRELGIQIITNHTFKEINMAADWLGVEWGRYGGFSYTLTHTHFQN